MSAPSKNENIALIERLQNQARKVLDALIPDSAHIILLDYPHYPNVGDSLIWLGEIAYLKSRGLKPSYVCDCHNFSSAIIKKIISKNSIILINGGGNFGDLWSHLHDFRLQILRDFPQTPIIQLPQTIHFKDEQNILETAEAIKQHGNFTLLVRSKESLAIAQKNFSTTSILCPDMAFFIGAVASKSMPVVDCFILSRTDTEKAVSAGVNSIHFDANITTETADWLNVSLIERLIIRIETHTVWFRRVFDKKNQLLLLIWNLLAWARLKRGVNFLSKGHTVLTDRLHAHILSTLMNKPHILVDNSYGKLGDFYHLWTSQYPYALFVKDVGSLQIEANVFVDCILNNKFEAAA